MVFVHYTKALWATIVQCSKAAWNVVWDAICNIYNNWHDDIEADRIPKAYCILWIVGAIVLFMLAGIFQTQLLWAIAVIWFFQLLILSGIWIACAAVYVVVKFIVQVTIPTLVGFIRKVFESFQNLREKFATNLREVQSADETGMLEAPDETSLVESPKTVSGKRKRVHWSI